MASGTVCLWKFIIFICIIGNNVSAQDLYENQPNSYNLKKYLNDYSLTKPEMNFLITKPFETLHQHPNKFYDKEKFKNENNFLKFFERHQKFLKNNHQNVYENENYDENNFNERLKKNSFDFIDDRNIMDNSLERNNDQTDYSFENKRSAALRSTIARRSQGLREVERNIADSVSSGALTNMQGFFDHLKTNIKSIEAKPNYTPNYVLNEMNFPKAENVAPKKEYLNDYHAKPSGTAAFIHAIRTYRPSQQIRALVSMQPESYRGANFHDPNYLWAGLGK